MLVSKKKKKTPGLDGFFMITDQLKLLFESGFRHHFFVRFCLENEYGGFFFGYISLVYFRMQ